MFTRLPITFVFGAAISLLVFWVLWFLISQPIDVGPMVQATRIDFTRMRKDSELKTKLEEKVQREPPPPTPDVPQMQFTNVGVNNNAIQITPNVNAANAVGNLAFTAGTDTDVVPLVRIPPQYPPRALSRGIEGWVQVQFTITETGSVINAKVVAAKPGDIFNEAALRAIARWRYNPKVEDGQPVQRVGVQAIIRFELSN